MGADNGIFVRQVGRTWYMRYGYMSDGDAGAPQWMREGTAYPSREAALIAAHDLAKTYTLLQYGVIEV